MQETETFYLSDKQREQLKALYKQDRKKKIARVIAGWLLFLGSVACGIAASFVEGDLSIILNGIMGIGIFACLIIAFRQPKGFPTISDEEKKELATEEIGKRQYP